MSNSSVISLFAMVFVFFSCIPEKRGENVRVRQRIGQARRAALRNAKTAGRARLVGRVG